MSLNRWQKIVGDFDRALQRVNVNSLPALDRLHRRIDWVYVRFPVEKTTVSRENLHDMCADAVAAQYEFCYNQLRHFRTRLDGLRLGLNRFPLLPHHHSALLALPKASL